ncbi:hypothetical protein Lser_V15G27863 [Lactuca serriola]
MEDYVNNPANMHDFSLMNTKAFANLKGSSGNIWEVFEVLDDARRAIFRDTVFGYFIDVPRLQGDALLFHKMFLHQIRPDPVLSPDGIKRLYFRVGNTKMVYGPEEFCLIIGFNFGEYPKNIGRKGSEKLISSKKRCLLRERLFPDHTNSSVKIGDLKRLILNQTFLALDDVDAVRVCLIYVLCEGFLGKEVNDRVPQDWFFFAENLDLWNSFVWGSYLWDFTYVDLEDTWNKIYHYLSLSERGQTLKYSVSGFTALIREGLPPRQNMLPGDGEMTSSYYMSFQEYVYGEGKAVPSPVRDHFRRQDESSSSMLSSGRSHGRGRGSGKHKLDEVLKRLHALEQHVFMNRQPTEVFGELRLTSMEVHIYDSLGRGAYEKFKSEGIFSKFERRVANNLDKIKYWARRNIPRIPLNMQFIYEENVPQQSSHLGDCGVFLCMFMEQLVSGQPICVLIDPKNATLEFRLRMAKIIWGSSLGPM